MLCLIFEVAGCRYAIEVRQIVGVVPRVRLRPVPHMPPFVEGLYNHGGDVVPVIDLGLLLTGQRCEPRLSTRLILTNYPMEEGRPARLALIAERVSDLKSLPRDRATPPPTSNPRASYLGPIVQVGDDMIQMLVVERLLDDDVRTALYSNILEQT